MQIKTANRRTIIAITMAFCSTLLVAEGFTHAQDRGGFKFSPPNRNVAAQDSESRDNRNLVPLNMNDLRGPGPATENLEKRSNFAPMQMPQRDDSTNRPVNSILDRATTNPAANPLGEQRSLPKFNPDAFTEPTRNHGMAESNISRPLQDPPRVSSEQFRMSDMNQGDIRTVSATMQDDGRNSAMGTTPLGNANQTQTRQDGSGFSSRMSQPTVNANLASQQSDPGNNSQNSGQSPFQSINQTPARQQPVQQLAQPQNRGIDQSLLNQNRGQQNPIGNNPLNNGMTTNSQPTTTNVNTSIAKRLMQQYSIDSAPQPLPGQPTSIEQMLQATSIQYRPAMVSQYWKTYQAWCNMMCCAQHVNALSQVTPPNNPAEKNLLNTANSIARNELLNAEIQLTQAQSKLQRFIPNSQNDLILPLPSDQPVISSYSTHYDYYSSRRAMPNEIRSIATTLPKMLTLISQRAQSAQDSQSSMQQIRQFAQGGQAPVSEVLQAVTMWSDANKQVVQSVVDYNQSIAAYSLNVMGSSKSPDQMAIALVGKPKSQATPATSQPNVRQATLPGELRNQRSPMQQGQTFNPRSGMQMNNNAMQNPNRDFNNNGSNSQTFRNPNAGGGFRN